MANKIKKIQLVKDGVTEEFDIAGGSGGTSDYADLENKPHINSVELDGNKTISDLDLISTDAGNGLEIGSDGKLLAKGSDGIMAEGTVRGVRTLVPSTSVSANLWKALKMSYLDGDETMLNSDGNFVAPNDGIYMISARPDDSATHSSVAHITSINKGTEYTPETTLAYAKSNTTTGSAILQASCVVKLKAGDVITVNFYAASAQTIKNQSTAMPCEFYLISERTDGLVAEAKYANQTFTKAVTKTIELIEATDTNVFPGNGQIVLPEDGSYIISADLVNGANTVTTHALRTYLYKDSLGGTVLAFANLTGVATAAISNLTHVVRGKKGDVFVLATLHDTYSYTYTRKATDDVSGVRLFKMSFTGTGGGGTGGTSDYEELENKPKINGVELIGDKTSAELDIFSKIDYEYEEEGGRLLLLADEGPGKELTVEHKTGETFKGKPVYETVWLTKLPKNGTSSSAAMDIPSTTVDNLEYLIEATGSLRTDTGNIRALAFSSGSINNSIYYNNTSHCFTLNNVGAIVAVDNQLIIKAQYTKTTD